MAATCLDAQWERIHPSSDFVRSFQKAVIPPGSSDYLAVGYDLAVSSDQGQHWDGHSFQLPVVPPIEGYDLKFVNADTAFLACRNQIFKTTDKGKNWALLLDLAPSHGNYISSAWFRSLFFLNASQGYAVGDFEKIFRTSDGGTTWDTLSWSSLTAPYVRYTSVAFLNESVGYIAGHRVDNILMNFNFTEFVMKTTDGGLNWTEATVPVVGDFRTLVMQFVSADTCFVHLKDTQGDDQLFNSSDGGATWIPVTPPLRKIYAAQWMDDRTGLAYGRDANYEYRLYRTENSGDLWESVSMPVFDNQIRDVIRDFAFGGGGNGFAVGDGGNIMVTTDKGKTWQSRNEAYPNFFTMRFPSKTTAFASSAKGFFRSEDGGQTWLFQEGSDSLQIADMEFTNETDGYFYGFRNYYYRVGDGGDVVQPLQLPRLFLSFSKMIVRNGSLHAAGPTIAPLGNVWMTSADGGTNWAVTELAVSEPVVDIDIAGNTFFLATTNAVLKSDDKGNSWAAILNLQTDYVQHIEFIHPQLGLVFLSSGKVLFTEDQGLTWLDVEVFGAETYIRDFLVVNDTLLFAYGSKTGNGHTLGAIWRSTDSGRHWKEEVLPLAIDLGITDMDIVGERLFASGGFGIVLQTDLPPVSTGAQEPSEKPELTLYPVPATDHLVFEVPEDIRVQSVRIIGAGGRIFADFAADRDRRVCTDHLPPGLYVLRVQTDQGVLIKRFSKV
ncbi:MAG: Ycf48-like protein [Saprospiraceae bacterium]|nr:Ycf48-like protein [Saprospiraceae bacterium]